MSDALAEQLFKEQYEAPSIIRAAFNREDMLPVPDKWKYGEKVPIARIKGEGRYETTVYESRMPAEFVHIVCPEMGIDMGTGSVSPSGMRREDVTPSWIAKTAYVIAGGMLGPRSSEESDNNCPEKVEIAAEPDNGTEEAAETSPKCRFILARHIDGITLNPHEYVLDDDGKVREFSTKDEILSLIGIETEEELEENGMYILTEEDSGSKS